MCTAVVLLLASASLCAAAFRLVGPLPRPGTPGTGPGDDDDAMRRLQIGKGKPSGYCVTQIGRSPRGCVCVCVCGQLLLPFGTVRLGPAGRCWTLPGAPPPRVFSVLVPRAPFACPTNSPHPFSTGVHGPARPLMAIAAPTLHAVPRAAAITPRSTVQALIDAAYEQRDPLVVPRAHGAQVFVALARATPRKARKAVPR